MLPIGRKNDKYSSEDSRHAVETVVDFGLAFGYPYGEYRGMSMVTGEHGSQLDRFPMGCEYHNHSHYELIYVLEGVLTQYLENSKYMLNAGDVSLMNRNIFHYEGPETNAVCVYVNMPPHFLDQLLHSNAISANQAQHSSTILAQFCSQDSDQMNRAALNFHRVLGDLAHPVQEGLIMAHRLLDQLARVMIEQPWGYAFLAQGLLLQFFQELENPARYHVTNIRVNSSPEEVLFMNIQHYMREQNGRVSRKDLANLLHYHQDHIGRVVKRQTGLSYVQYSQKIWIQKAKNLLTNSDMSISDIIKYLAFENRHYFYRIFAENTGMTPQEYRMNHSIQK